MSDINGLSVEKQVIEVTHSFHISTNRYEGQEHSYDKILEFHRWKSENDFEQSLCVQIVFQQTNCYDVTKFRMIRHLCVHTLL